MLYGTVGMSESRFWFTDERAGPTAWDVARFWDRSPRYMRAEGCSKPTSWVPNSGSVIIIEAPVRLTADHSATVSAFWREHYGEEDWMLDAEKYWVSNILSCSRTLALGAFQDGRLIGTILSRPSAGSSSSNSKGGHILWGTDGYIINCAVIEGLCVHTDYRNQHLAGWLISWVDYLTSRVRPVAHFWMREVGSYIPTTDVATHKYGYVRIADLGGVGSVAPTPPTPPIRELQISEFDRLWITSCAGWRSAESLIASRPYWGHACWKIWRVGDKLAVILDTRRKTRGPLGPKETIWEVVWCGHMYSEANLEPVSAVAVAQTTTQWRDMFETVALQLKSGLLFVSDDPLQGGASEGWGTPWRFGTSGFHSAFLYNFMPPRFWKCRMMLPREEI